MTQEQQAAIAAIVDLVAEGDIDLDKARQDYRTIYGVDADQTDEQLHVVFASQSDDYGSGDIVRRMAALYHGVPLNWESEQA